MGVVGDKGPTARRAAFAAVTALALALRLFHLGHENLWIDEVFQVGVASQPVATIVSQFRPTASYYTRDQAPLSMIVGHFFVGGRDQEWMPRIPSALFGTLEVLTFFMVASRLVGFGSALVASVLLALSPLHLWYSQEARWYAQWSFLSTLSYLLLLRASARSKPSRWMLYGLVRLASLYTFLLSVFVAAAQLVTVIWHARGVGPGDQRRGSEQPYLVAGSVAGRGSRGWRLVSSFVMTNVAVAIAGVPVLWMALRLSGHGSGTPRAASLFELLYTAYAYAVGVCAGPTLAYLHSTPPLASILVGYPIVPVVAVVFGVLLVLGTVALVRNPTVGSVVLPWLLVPPLLVFVLGAVTNITYQVRYTLAALPAFYLTVVVGASTLRPRALRGVAVIAVMACTVYAVGGYFYDARYDKEDVKGALAYVAEHGAPQAQVIAVGQIGLAVEYYAGMHGMTVVYGCAGDHADRSGPGVATTVDLGREVWVVSGRDWTNETAKCLERLRATHTAPDRTDFTGVVLRHFAPHGSSATAGGVNEGSAAGLGGSRGAHVTIRGR